MRAVSLSLGEAWMHSLDRPMPAPPQGPPRGGCILGPHISVVLEQKTANFKVAIPNGQKQWSHQTAEKQPNQLARFIKTIITMKAAAITCSLAAHQRCTGAKDGKLQGGHGKQTNVMEWNN